MCKVMHEEQVVLDVSTPPEPEPRGATSAPRAFTQWKILGPEIFIEFLSCNTWIL